MLRVIKPKFILVLIRKKITWFSHVFLIYSVRVWSNILVYWNLLKKSTNHINGLVKSHVFFFAYLKIVANTVELNCVRGSFIFAALHYNILWPFVDDFIISVLQWPEINIFVWLFMYENNIPFCQHSENAFPIKYSQR